MKKNIFIVIILIFIFGYAVINLGYSRNKDDNGIQGELNIKEENLIIEDDELFSEYYEKAESIMSNMSMENKISQLFLISTQTSTFASNIDYVGGYIFYSNFFSIRNKNSTSYYISNLQKKSSLNYAIVVDEEGGTVSRISKYDRFRKERFPSPGNLYKKGGLDLILEIEDEKDELLKSLGFNLNLAPVADISSDKSSFIYDRTLGQNLDTTSNYIAEVTKRAKSNGISTCLKHFPGYGDNKDTHEGLVIDNRELDYLRENDFVTFKAGIEAQTPFIMISHHLLNSVDSEYPATLSKKVIDILKNELNFSGIILTDDISMSALEDFESEAAILALLAGNDMIMTSNYNKFYNQLVDAYREGKITKERINYSVRKIIAWKLAYGIIDEG